MYPAKFDYYRAQSLDDALRFLGQHPEAKLLAGGHSLIPMLKLRLAQPSALVDVGRIDELRGITRGNGTIHVGALTTHTEIAASDILRESCPLLAEAAGKIGDPAVRNKGTLGGNVAHADPASDLPAVLLAVGARLHLVSSGGRRSVAAADFFLDLLTTDLQAGEVLTGVEVDEQGPGTGSAYLKVEHPASGYALCGAAALVEMEGGSGACLRARLCFNGIAAVPVDAEAVSGALIGTSLDDATIAAAVATHLAVADPLGDVQASGPYRVELAKVYGQRALRRARDRARGGSA